MYLIQDRVHHYDGYSRNVDVESRLHNSFHPLQKCVQGKYIPGTNSDMFNSNYLIPTTKPVKMTNNLLFKRKFLILLILINVI